MHWQNEPQIHMKLSSGVWGYGLEMLYMDGHPSESSLCEASSYGAVDGSFNFIVLKLVFVFLYCC